MSFYWRECVPDLPSCVVAPGNPSWSCALPSVVRRGEGVSHCMCGKCDACIMYQCLVDHCCYSCPGLPHTCLSPYTPARRFPSTRFLFPTCTFPASCFPLPAITDPPAAATVSITLPAYYLIIPPPAHPCHFFNSCLSLTAISPSLSPST